MSQVEDDLKEAFAGESQANRKYLAFAQKALDEGYAGIARLFEAVAAAETIHAHKHLRTLKGIKGTAENLKEAIGGETYEFTSMYPKMIADAKQAGERQAEISFTYANEVEKIHAGLYKQAMEMMEQFPVQDYYVCSICGHTAVAEAPDPCPVCGAAKKNFFKV